jgi:transposase
LGFNMPAMPGPYSLDLRTRIVAAVQSQEYTNLEIAELFGVHESYIYKLLRHYRKQGTLEPLPRGGGAVPKLKQEHLPILKSIVEEFPDAILEELRDLLGKRARIKVSIWTIHRALKKLDITRKKSPSWRRKPILKSEPNSSRVKKD